VVLQFLIEAVYKTLSPSIVGDRQGFFNKRKNF